MTTVNPLNVFSRLAALRHEQTALLDAHRSLLAHGMGSQTTEVHGRLADISAEAFAIADQLRTLGRHDQADDALTGWAIPDQAHLTDTPARSHTRPVRSTDMPTTSYTYFFSFKFTDANGNTAFANGDITEPRPVTTLTDVHSFERMLRNRGHRDAVVLSFSLLSTNTGGVS